MPKVIRRWCADCDSNVPTRIPQLKIGIPIILALCLTVASSCGRSVTDGDESIAARFLVIYLSAMLLFIWAAVNAAWYAAGKFKLYCNVCGRTNLTAERCKDNA